MKKTFPLHVEGKTRQRVLQVISMDLSRYTKRERRKALPEGVDYWDFNCRIGPNAESATVTSISEIHKAVERVAQTDAEAVYVEILVCDGHRSKGSPKNPSEQEDS